MKNACEGVMYPQNAVSCIRLKPAQSPNSSLNRPQTAKLMCNTHELEGFLVPHKSWQYCKEELEIIFSYLNSLSFVHNAEITIFVLAPLHKGPIVMDSMDDGVKTAESSSSKIYSPQDGLLKGSDWEISLKTPEKIKAFVEQNDDICTEEHSLEVIAPFIYKTMPHAQVCYLLAPNLANKAENEKLCEITSIIGRLYSNSIIFLSSNEETNCAYMWKKE